MKNERILGSNFAENQTHITCTDNAVGGSILYKIRNNFKVILYIFLNYFRKFIEI